MKTNAGVCIVTGSATGIGAACVVELARRGWRTVINYTRSEAEAQATAQECAKHGAETLLVRADVSQDADCRRMVDAALEKWGRIDALVNNAGVTKVAFNHGDLDALDADDFHRIYGVNVVGAFQMVRAVAPAMQRQGAGAIVNVSSRAGVDSLGTSLAYAATKGALNTLTIGLARALGPHIRVNAVCPGFVETRWLQGAIGPRYEAARERYAAASALQRTSTPEDVADAVVWLLTGARALTGELLLIDSGNRLGPPPKT
jgi:3-oxoacyl-[acyl-carrier protein] reductase